MTPRALCLLLSAALLTSCASEPEHVVTVRETVVIRSPEALRTCAPMPAVPPADAPGSLVAAFMLHLAHAYRDCADTLAARNQWEDEAAARVEGD